jgi:hypothetical protein
MPSCPPSLSWVPIVPRFDSADPTSRTIIRPWLLRILSYFGTISRKNGGPYSKSISYQLRPKAYLFRECALQFLSFDTVSSMQMRLLTVVRVGAVGQFPLNSLFRKRSIRLFSPLRHNRQSQSQASRINMARYNFEDSVRYQPKTVTKPPMEDATNQWD